MKGLLFLLAISVWLFWYAIFWGISKILSRWISSERLFSWTALLAFLLAWIGSVSPLYFHELRQLFLLASGILLFLSFTISDKSWLQRFGVGASIASISAYFWLSQFPEPQLGYMCYAVSLFMLFLALVRVGLKLSISLRWLFAPIFLIGIFYSSQPILSTVFGALILVPSSAPIQSKSYWYLHALAATIVLVSWKNTSWLQSGFDLHHLVISIAMLASTMIETSFRLVGRLPKPSPLIVIYRIAALIALVTLVFGYDESWFFAASAVYFLTLVASSVVISSRPLKEVNPVSHD
jgi:hypothetical protein